MTVFGNYAQYYDLLYRDKDYAGEAQFIHRLIQTHSPNAQSVLELGCGTGIHAILLAEKGYQLQGVDLSREMLAKADDRLTQLPPELSANIQFGYGDIREVRLNQTFDVVLSLFHVISYQTSNDDLLAALTTAKQHLKPGGILIFDIWYGPGVLSDRPAVRIKRMEDEAIQVTRVCEPVIYPNQNWVDVNYQVFIRDKASQAVEEVRETHRLRYLFQPELEILLNQLQMTTLASGEWLSDQPIGFNTWQTYFVAKA
jgi:SAM-dependent methyltransferase